MPLHPAFIRIDLQSHPNLLVRRSAELKELFVKNKNIFIKYCYEKIAENNADRTIDNVLFITKIYKCIQISDTPYITTHEEDTHEEVSPNKRVPQMLNILNTIYDTFGSFLDKKLYFMIRENEKQILKIIKELNHTFLTSPESYREKKIRIVYTCMICNGKMKKCKGCSKSFVCYKCDIKDCCLGYHCDDCIEHTKCEIYDCDSYTCVNNYFEMTDCCGRHICGYHLKSTIGGGYTYCIKCR